MKEITEDGNYRKLLWINVLQRWLIRIPTMHTPMHTAHIHTYVHAYQVNKMVQFILHIPYSESNLIIVPAGVTSVYITN